MSNLLERLVLLLGLLFCSFSTAAPVASDASPVASSNPPLANDAEVDGSSAFVLAGDSTTAVNGGWGDGFIQTLQVPANGKNLGHSGATTVSFRAGGDWNKVLSSVKEFRGSSLARRDAMQNKAAHFVLTGDSTTAKQSEGGGGWGDGFLRTLQSPSDGANYGRNGATTVSFKKDEWGKAMADASRNANSKTVYVTIQVCDHIIIAT
jgi:hypothetical protein